MVRVLDVEWRCPTLTETKEYAKRIDNFYSGDIVFEGSIAHCTRELGMDVGTKAGESQQLDIIKASKANARVS